MKPKVRVQAGLLEGEIFKETTIILLSPGTKETEAKGEA